jgi:hypothetical protein
LPKKSKLTIHNQSSIELFCHLQPNGRSIDFLLQVRIGYEAILDNETTFSSKKTNKYTIRYSKGLFHDGSQESIRKCIKSLLNDFNKVFPNPSLHFCGYKIVWGTGDKLFQDDKVTGFSQPYYTYSLSPATLPLPQESVHKNIFIGSVLEGPMCIMVNFKPYEVGRLNNNDLLTTINLEQELTSPLSALISQKIQDPASYSASSFASGLFYVPQTYSIPSLLTDQICFYWVEDYPNKTFSVYCRACLNETTVNSSNDSIRTCTITKILKSSTHSFTLTVHADAENLRRNPTDLANARNVSEHNQMADSILAAILNELQISLEAPSPFKNSIGYFYHVNTQKHYASSSSSEEVNNRALEPQLQKLIRGMVAHSWLNLNYKAQNEQDDLTQHSSALRSNRCVIM